MMGRKAARNMWSSNINKIGIQCISWFYSRRTAICVGSTEDILRPENCLLKAETRSGDCNLATNRENLAVTY
jgi:hypothetical protein